MQQSQIRGVIVRAQRLVVSVARLVLRELDMSATGGSRQFAKRLKSAFGQRRRLGRPVTSGLTPISGPSRSWFGLRIRAKSRSLPPTVRTACYASSVHVGAAGTSPSWHNPYKD